LANSFSIRIKELPLAIKQDDVFMNSSRDVSNALSYIGIDARDSSASHRKSYRPLGFATALRSFRARLVMPNCPVNMGSLH
jgi:hypothetical protein